MQPRLLRPDNFTPPARTPWGGRRILERYKADLDLGEVPPVIGESWEVSVEPDFPSAFRDTGQPLADAIAADPEGWLGAEVAARYDGQTPLLVKLLDSAENLSVQVHPADDDPGLGPDESGKPECWLILAAEPGAGIYLGFRDGVERRDVERCLADGGRLDALLNFVPVEPGEVYLLRAGSPHSIGAGVTLVEPQLVWPGRRGITYRFWDWNRRYDANGLPDADGEPRPLHLERSLDTTDWYAPRGQAFVNSCKSRPRVIAAGALERLRLAAFEGMVVEEWRGSGALDVPTQRTMWALTCIDGAARLAGGAGAVELGCGLSCVVPAEAGRLRLEARSTRIVATRSSLQPPR